MVVAPNRIRVVAADLCNPLEIPFQSEHARPSDLDPVSLLLPPDCFLIRRSRVPCKDNRDIGRWWEVGIGRLGPLDDPFVPLAFDIVGHSGPLIDRPLRPGIGLAGR